MNENERAMKFGEVQGNLTWMVRDLREFDVVGHGQVYQN